MYTLLSGLYKYVFQKDEYCILILGLDNAGKTVCFPRPRPRWPGPSTACSEPSPHPRPWDTQVHSPPKASCSNSKTSVFGISLENDSSASVPVSSPSDLPGAIKNPV